MTTIKRREREKERMKETKKENAKTRQVEEKTDNVHNGETERGRERER